MIRTGGGLQTRSHFTGVQGSDAGVAIAGDEESGRIFCAVDDALIRRVGIEILELIGIFGAAVFGRPIRAVKKLLEAQHIQERISANDGAEHLRVLGERRAHQQPSVAAARNGEARRRGVFVDDQEFGSCDEVIEDRLLSLEHAGAVPGLADFTPAPKIGVSYYSAMLNPDNQERPVEGSRANVETTVASEKNGVRTVQLQAFLVKEKHGDAGLVFGGIPDLFDLESRRIDLDFVSRPDLGFSLADAVLKDGGGGVVRFG